MSEENLKPIVIPSIYDIEQQLVSVGLKYEDIITLIHRRCKGKVTKKQIRATYEAIKSLEKQITKAQKGNDK